MDYRFPLKKPKAPSISREFRLPVEEPNLEPPIGLIQGKMPASRAEWNVGNGLWQLGWRGRFRFQVPIQGGSTRRGGQIIDFIIETLPLPTPTYVNSRYHHRRELEEIMKIYRLMVDMKGHWNPPLIIWHDQVSTIQDAYNLLSHKVGRA